jgi:hypothetical protein
MFPAAPPTCVGARGGGGGGQGGAGVGGQGAGDEGGGGAGAAAGGAEVVRVTPAEEVRPLFLHLVCA